MFEEKHEDILRVLKEKAYPQLQLKYLQKV